MFATGKEDLAYDDESAVDIILLPDLVSCWSVIYHYIIYCCSSMCWSFGVRHFLLFVFELSLYYLDRNGVIFCPQRCCVLAIYVHGTVEVTCLERESASHWSVSSLCLLAALDVHPFCCLLVVSGSDVALPDARQWQRL